MKLNLPLAETDAPRYADVVVAAIIGIKTSPFRVAGIGHGTDATLPGDRDWLSRPALRAAVDASLVEAGITMADIDLFEIDGMTLADEVTSLEALGLAAPGDGYNVYAGSERINQSGGSAAGWCYPAMGLVRFAECMCRLEGGARRALAVGSSPVGGQTQTAVIVEKS